MCITSRCLPNQHFTYIINLTIIFLQDPYKKFK